MITRIEIDKFDEYYITIPEELIRELNWESGDEIDIAVVIHNETGNKLLVCSEKPTFAKSSIVFPKTLVGESEVNQYVKKLS